MGYTTEAQLENQLLQQLQQLGYAPVVLADGTALVANLKKQLEAFNSTPTEVIRFTDKEFEMVLNHLAKGRIFEKAKTLRDYFQFKREDGTPLHIRFFNSEDPSENLYQVSNQISQEGHYKNRYDVTLLVNGLPLVQIELKRLGVELKEAFNQINRYQQQSFWSTYSLFQYVQLFVISNSVDTKYFSNNDLQSSSQTFYWTDSQNKKVSELTAFAATFLNTTHLGTMIARYIVLNENLRVPMALRPYQYYAAEAIQEHVRTSAANAYIWHTTGSGKTLTSFKTSQLLIQLPEVHKVVFVVDRKDLDSQTMKEFNHFKKDSVSGTGDTHTLVSQLKDDKTRLVLTTIQKLNNALSDRYRYGLTQLQDKKLVFIFDECHRSQFGETHDRITKFFNKSQLIGFTGTPIFADNATKNELGKRTTKDLFGTCLHKYVITDAIRDENVLRFGIEYIGKYRYTSKAFLDIEVEDIDTKEVLDSTARLSKIVDYIIAYHDQKTQQREFSALFAVSSIGALIKYYDIFKQKKQEGLHDLRIATIFTYGANPDSERAKDDLPDDYDEMDDLDSPFLDQVAETQVVYGNANPRDKLEEYIGDYNALYGTAYTTKDSKLFNDYFQDITNRLKKREKVSFDTEANRLDIVIVVNMMLTGFDAKKLNTLYVDKNLQQHGLIQAFSRTNRIYTAAKSEGHIVCFRNLKKATDEAIQLFSNKEAIEEVLLPDYTAVAETFDAALDEVRKITPTFQSVDDLKNEEEDAKFVRAFRRLLRALNVLQAYTDFDWDDFTIDQEEFKSYETKYLELKERVKRNEGKDKASILDDIDFETELIHRDKITVAYIMKLLAQLKDAPVATAAAQRKAILDTLAGDTQLQSKRALIEKFIDEHMPTVVDADAIDDAFEQYWQDQKVLALAKLCEEEKLDQAQFKALIDTYIYSGREPIKDEVFQCLDNRPSLLQARTIGDRILSKMKEYVEVFVKGMIA